MSSNVFTNMNNVGRSKLISKLNYSKNYKYDIRIFLKNSIQSHTVTLNNSYSSSLFIGPGISFMIYNLVFMTYFDYYVCDIYSIGYYDYSFLNLNFLTGIRFLINFNDNFLTNIFKTNNLINEVLLGVKRMKVYSPFDIDENEEVITPTFMLIFTLDYIHKQIGLSVQYILCNLIHNMALSSIIPGIILKL